MLKETKSNHTCPYKAHRANPIALKEFDPRTKMCTENCGPASDDPRSHEERKFLCSDCTPVQGLFVYLKDKDGKTFFSQQIDNKFKEIAKVAGIYDCLWVPDEHGISTAVQMVEPLIEAVTDLVADQKKYEAFDSSDVWQDFLQSCSNYLKACRMNPESVVSVSRERIGRAYY